MSGRMWIAGLLLSATAEAGTIYTVRADNDTLLAFDTRTHALTVVGPLGVNFDFGSLEWSATDNTMYMVGGRATPALFRVDLQTGAATLVGAHNQTDIFSLAWDPTTNRLYGGQASQAMGLWQIDTRTGAATYIGNPRIGMSGADWDPQGRGIVANAIATADFYLIDPTTAASTLLGSGRVFLNDGGLAYDADTQLFYFFDWSGNIYSFDPAAGYQATLIQSGLPGMDGASAADGAGFHGTMHMGATQGVCPGPQTFQISGATPGGVVVLMRGGRLGGSRIPAGPCSGTSVPLSSLQVIDRYIAGPMGNVTFHGTSSAQHCGTVRMIALDLDSCDLSNIQTP
ncbi:MAG TPA: hypothetical protein PKA64_00370 [Myxococcota bacterium]|nr:hypothetical protein [Myxococcota bacterium]